MPNTNIVSPPDTFKAKNAASTLSPNERKKLAVRAIADQSPISSLAKETNTSRKFIYSQKGKAVKALDAAFSEDKEDEEKVLFYLPITKAWLKQLVIALILICHSSYQGVIEICRDLLNVAISKGGIHNILQGVVEKVREIHCQQDLSQVRVGAHDEIFQNGSPVLVGCDAHSTYCYLLSEEQHRDGDTWGTHLLDLQKKSNLNPDYSVADGGAGLRRGQKEAWPNIPCFGDVFHALMPFLAVASYLGNRALGAMSAVSGLDKKLSKPRKMSDYKKHKTLTKKRSSAETESLQAIEIADDVHTLYNWLKDDILSLVGPSLKERQELLNFVIEELKRVEPHCFHKIHPLRVFLENNQDNLLEFSGVIDKELLRISFEFQVCPTRVRAVYGLQGLPSSSQKRWRKESEARNELGNRFYPIQNEVEEVLSKIVRASSVVENLNSRLRNYFTLRKNLGKGYLDLLRFFLNHRRFMRSERADRVGKSPRELMTKSNHEHWLELLGFRRFKRAA